MFGISPLFLFFFSKICCINDEMIYEMDHILTADMKSSEAMILAVMNAIDLFTDTAAILISIVSNSYYGMPRGQTHVNLPP